MNYVCIRSPTEITALETEKRLDGLLSKPLTEADYFVFSIYKPHQEFPQIRFSVKAKPFNADYNGKMHHNKFYTLNCENTHDLTQTLKEEANPVSDIENLDGAVKDLSEFYGVSVDYELKNKNQRNDFWSKAEYLFAINPQKLFDKKQAKKEMWKACATTILNKESVSILGLKGIASLALLSPILGLIYIGYCRDDS